MKNILSFFVSLALAAGMQLHAQTNTFPSSGNVGIGTTTPGKPLQVSGPGNFYSASEQVRVTDPINGMTLSLLVDGTNSLCAIYATIPGTGYKPLYIQPYGQNTLINSNGGNAGIGTANPNQRLSVADSLSVTNAAGGQCLLIGNQDSGGVNDPAMIEGVNGALWFGHGSSWAGQGGTMTQNVTFTQNGNVGIGTTSPLAKLHVYAGGIFNQTAAGQAYFFGGNADGGVNGKYSAIGMASGGYITFNSATDALVPTEYARFTNGGNLGIGTNNPTQKLDVNGAIHAHEVIVDTNGADYVFAPNYKLMLLPQVEQAIQRDKHLPGIPSAQEMSSSGMSMGDMQTKLLAKVEELTLLMIQQDKKMQQQSQQLQDLKAENAAMQARLNAMAK